MRYSNDPSGLKRSLAAARAEIERLTTAHDTVCGALATAIKRAETAEAERDEARAQVKAAYAYGWRDGNHPDAREMPLFAQAALEDYVREKVREAFLWKLTRVGHSADNPAIIDMVEKDLAEMEKLK